MDHADPDHPLGPHRRRRRRAGWVIVISIAVAVMVTATAAFAVAVHSRHPVRRASSSHAPTAPPRWTVVGLGDSVPRAAGCACTSFVTLYGERIARDTGAHVTVHNLGVNGQTSGGLRAALAGTGAEAATVRRASVVTLTIGANDFNYALSTLQRGRCGGADGLDCFGATVATVQRNVRAIIERIKTLRAGRPIAIRVTGYWNVFQDGAVATGVGGPAFLRGSDLLTRQVNAVIKKDAVAEHVAYVDIYTPFKGKDGDIDDTALLAPDGDHPSQAGHRVIAKALAAAGYSPLD
ncbi:MAG TPA: SGNH/GDSL hydrolase family protein [Mycobacteriales bacterium]|jgi:lysophospholipase L1-like esterase